MLEPTRPIEHPSRHRAEPHLVAAAALRQQGVVAVPRRQAGVDLLRAQDPTRALHLPLVDRHRKNHFYLECHLQHLLAWVLLLVWSLHPGTLTND